MTAVLAKRGQELKSFSWSDDVAKVFLLFDDIVWDVNAELTKEGVAVPAPAYPRRQEARE